MTAIYKTHTMEMDTPESTPNGLQAYQTSLEQQGMRRGEILRRMHMARCIQGAIAKDRPPHVAYRDAVDIVLGSMPDDAAAELCRQVARDLYSFCNGSQVMAPEAATREPHIQVMLPEHRTLDDLVRIAPSIPLDRMAEEALEEYAAALQTRMLDDRSLENRMVISRVLLIGMRGLSWDGRHYRAVVDKLLPLFNREDTRLYFLVVAREFFSWINPIDPSTPGMSHDPLLIINP